MVNVLETVAISERAPSIPELIQMMKLPKPTVHRMVTQLEEAGYLTRNASTRRLLIGPRLERLALTTLSAASESAARHAILLELVNTIGETCNLTTIAGNEVVYLDRVEANWPLKVDLKPGSRVPLHCSATGKLFLSQMPRKRRQVLLESMKRDSFTVNTITDVELLQAELDRTQSRLIGIDNEEYIAGLCCVAVPVLDPRGRCFAALAVQAPSARMPLNRALDHVSTLRNASVKLAQTFFPANHAA